MNIANRLAPGDDANEATPERLSVYGHLLLQGAMAAARIGDSATVRDLLTSADEAACRLGGVGLSEIARDVVRFQEAARQQRDASLQHAGFFRYRNGGEYHSFNPAVFRALHRAARSGGDARVVRACRMMFRPPSR